MSTRSPHSAFRLTPVLLSLFALPLAAQPQTWRIAVAGGQSIAVLGGDIPGPLSLLAQHGLPRERIDVSELTDVSRLRQFNVVIAAWQKTGTDEALRALEQFAFEGGIAITEGWPLPSPQVAAGRRLGPARTSNIRFVASDSPISQGLPEIGVIPTAGCEAGAIIPEPGSKAIVLARYTDEDTPAECRGQLRDGDQGAPAVLLIPYGKGYIVYSGPYISPNLSRKGQLPAPFVCRVLSVLSKGELADRLFTGSVDRADLLTLNAAAAPVPSYPCPSGAAHAVPKGFDVLEDATQLQDFCLRGKLLPSGKARALIGYWSDRDTTELAFAPGKLNVRRVCDGQASALRSVPLPASGGEITITRREGLLTVTDGGRLVYGGFVGPPRQGALATIGLQDPAYQPLAPVSFTDDFMRGSDDAGQWEPQSGKWQVVASEGKRETDANPFNYQVHASPEALSLTGQWFWSDYACGVSVQGSGEAVGVVADYAGKDDYLLFRLTFAASGARMSSLQLVRRQGAAEAVLAETTVRASRTDWHRLELRTSRGRTQGRLNGQTLLQAAVPPTVCGPIGLYCRNGNASFDDVKVEPWIASSPQPAPQVEEAMVSSGAWSAETGAQALAATDAKGARLLLPWPRVADCLASVKVRVGQADAGGLLLRGTDASWVLAALCRSGDQLRLRAYRQGTPASALAEVPVAGSPAAWHVLSARFSGPRLQISVDGKPAADVLDGVSVGGAVGLYARGGQAAQFQGLEAWSEPAPDRLADQVTPSFVGVIDRHTWAGRSGAWTPDPARVNCLWHQGHFPGAVRLNVGVHPQGAPQTTSVLRLGQRLQPDSGYAVTAERVWAQATVNLTLTLGGQPVAHGTTEVTAAKLYAICLERSGTDLLVMVDGKTALAWRDSQARPELCSLALDNGGQLIIADDVAVSSPLIHDDTFETAPTDWTVGSGTWKVSSRWSCSPGWSWFTGANPDGPVLVGTRQRYTGDMDVTAYFGAKMMPSGEKLADVHLGCCADVIGADSGYSFVVSGDRDRKTVLLRDGKQVASSDFRIAQGQLLHNDWLRLTVRRRGPQISLSAWDSPVLSWTDPRPLSDGLIVLGTERNGIVVPRVSIYGQQVEAGDAPPPMTARPTVAHGPTGLVQPLPLLTFTRDEPKTEFGGDWGLWPQQGGCTGTATWMDGQDAEGGAGGAMRAEYTIKDPPHSFSLWLTSGNDPADLTAYDRLVFYARGDVPSLTLVVKDRTATDPDAPAGVADYLVRGLTAKWQRFEVPFRAFVPRAKAGRVDWRAINHIGFAMIAPQNAASGTFWVDNLRAEAGAGR